MWKWLVGAGVAVLIIIMGIVGVYNNLVSKDQRVSESFAEIENQLQRRYDLIPNLVSTVKGYAKHERELFEGVTKARSAWMGAGTQSEKVAAANNIEGFLGRLIAVAENYPVLMASANFRALQDELAGTENRIAVARMRFNEAVKEYNSYAKRIPAVFFVGMFGFESGKEFFQIKDAAARDVPKVTF